jgi:hypothetical protein
MYNFNDELTSLRNKKALLLAQANLIDFAIIALTSDIEDKLLATSQEDKPLPVSKNHSREHQVLNYLKTVPFANISEIAKVLGVRYSSAAALLQYSVRGKKVVRVGVGKYALPVDNHSQAINGYYQTAAK